MVWGHELEVTVISARYLKNINCLHGDLMPYAVLWVDPTAKFPTMVGDGSTNPTWNQKVTLPLSAELRVAEAVLSIEIFHSGNLDDPLVGYVHVPLREIIDEVGFGCEEAEAKCLNLRRPSGRQLGELDVKIVVNKSSRSYDSPLPTSNGSHDYSGFYGYTQPHVASLPFGCAYSSAPSPWGCPYSAAPLPCWWSYSAEPSPRGYPYSAAPLPCWSPHSAAPSWYPYSAAPFPSRYPYSAAPSPSQSGYPYSAPSPFPSGYPYSSAPSPSPSPSGYPYSAAPSPIGYRFSPSGHHYRAVFPPQAYGQYPM